MAMFCFQNGGCPPSWIFKNVKFYLLMTSGDPRCRTVPNFLRMGQSTADIQSFFIFFQSGGHPHLGYETFSNFIGWQGPGARCIIVPNFVKIRQSVVGIPWFSTFRDGGCHHLRF